MDMVWVKNEKGEMVEVPKRKVSRVPTPKGSIRSYTPKVPVYKSLHPSAVKALKQYNKYHGEKE